jgi:adenylate cyclase
MSKLRDLALNRRRRGFAFPAWLERLVSAGITDSDPQVVRRQRCANVAAYATAANAAQHLIVNILYSYQDLLVTHIYNAIIVVLALSIPRLHRFGPNAAVNALLPLIISGHMFVIWMFGLESGLQIYFALSGAILFLVGVEQWRVFLAWFAVAFVAFIVTIELAPDQGLLVTDPDFRRSLADQALINLFLINAIIIFFAVAALEQAEAELEEQHRRSEALLEILMPVPIATRLKSGEERIADRIPNLSVLFADIVGFTGAAQPLPPAEVVDYLHSLIRDFDAVCEAHGAEKIKTIGDSYMAVAGLKEQAIDGAVTIGRLALAMLETMKRQPPLGSCRLTLRVGLHCGTAVAGVIGETRIAYDVWGQTVNLASRMESHGVPGRIQVSEAFQALTAAKFIFEDRGTIDLKGIGRTRTYFLIGPSKIARDA